MGSTLYNNNMGALDLSDGRGHGGGAFHHEKRENI